MSRPRGVRQETRGQRRVEDEENEDKDKSKVQGRREFKIKARFKIKAGSRLEQGSREIHKLFAKELNYRRESPLYIVEKGGCAPARVSHNPCTASMTNRKSSV